MNLCGRKQPKSILGVSSPLDNKPKAKATAVYTSINSKQVKDMKGLRRPEVGGGMCLYLHAKVIQLVRMPV